MTSASRFAPSSLGLACVLLLTACTHIETSVGRPLPPAKATHLSVGTSNLGQVLDRLGPPSQLSATAEGFAMLYEYNLITEDQLGISVPETPLEYIKLVGADADLKHTCWLMTFNREGTLTAWGTEHWEHDFGGGFAAQIIVTAKNIVDTTSVSQPASQHAWGRASLSRLPRTLNVGQSLTHGGHGLAQTQSPDAVGQRTLENPNPEARAIVKKRSREQ